jgi:hypothetical protein
MVIQGDFKLINHENEIASQVEVETPYSYVLPEVNTKPSLTHWSCLRRCCRRDQYSVVITQRLIEKHCRKHKSSMNECYNHVGGSIDTLVATTGEISSVVMEQDTDFP